MVRPLSYSPDVLLDADAETDEVGELEGVWLGEVDGVGGCDRDGVEVRVGEFDGVTEGVRLLLGV